MLRQNSVRSLLATLILLCISLTAMADGRNFPAHAKRGELSVTKLADLVINGKVKLTTPATRMYSEDGMLITSSGLNAVKAPVNYTENEFGEIETLWLLSVEEAKVALPKKPAN
ncbi:MAG: hypothetical protein V4447_17970 [Pseudomonadota bacterium]